MRGEKEWIKVKKTTNEIIEIRIKLSQRYRFRTYT